MIWNVKKIRESFWLFLPLLFLNGWIQEVLGIIRWVFHESFDISNGILMEINCYACLMHCFICQTIIFFHEVNETICYPFFSILHIFSILLAKSTLLVVVSFWHYDIVSMLQKLLNSWYKTDGLSLVAMLICLCLNLLFTFLGLFLSLAWVTFVFCIAPWLLNCVKLINLEEKLWN